MSGYVFNARAATEEYAHERTDDFTVLVTIGFCYAVLYVESITSDKRASNCSMIENIPPKGVIESNFICTLAMSAEDWFDFYCNTKLSESSDMTKHWVIYYYSVL